MSVARINSNPVSAVNLQEQIRFRAYELFEKRGGEHGRDLDDWLQAEVELLRSKMEPPIVPVAKAAAAAATSTIAKPAAKRTTRTKPKN